MKNKKKITINDLINKVKEYNDNESDIKLIEESYWFAYKKHLNQKRISGDDYIEHPLEVAYILTDINADATCLSAALLHDTIEDSNGTYDEIKENFGEEIANLVMGITQINKLHFHSDSEQTATYQRKILVGLSEDVRVLIIKLADRLHNMRTLYVLSDEKQKKKAKETLEILTPVAHRLGINKIKSELEDLSLRYLKPDAYYDIVEKLNNMKKEKDDNVGSMLIEVSNLLNEHHIKHEIKGRTKSVYSIYNKLNKGKKWSQIYDIFALRVLVNTEEECYQVLGLIHSKYKPVPGRFKDYIAMPKTNMYQSLHTTVIGSDGELFEIQIRTYDMNKIAEYGIASHWSYKEHSDGSKAIKDTMEKKLSIFRSIIELNEESTSSEEFISSIKKDVLPEDSIFVYTPKGDVIELPKGATPVDFAYKVHSEVGDKTTGAIVNDIIVPLDYTLLTGDVIKINTSKSSKGPNIDWLNFVVTQTAKNHIKAYHNRIEKDENVVKGSEALEKELRKNSLAINEIINSKELENIIENHKLNDINELYIAIGSGKISPVTIVRELTQKEEKEKPLLKLNNQANLTKVNYKNDILVEGLEDIKVNISNCCNPIPGDNIIGYVTKGAGITIHRSNCHNITETNERLINVKWNEQNTKKYKTELIIYATNDNNLVDIVTISASNNIVVDALSTINKNDYKAYNVTLLVNNLEELNKYCLALNNLPTVTKVERRMN